MWVPESTVRKRVERGLDLLRERLDREFGSRSSAWAIALLEPGLHSAVFKGVGLMNLKWSAAAGVVILLAGATWYVRDISGSSVSESIGGTGVVVPMQVAVEREKQLPIDVPGPENPEARRATEAAPPAPRAPELHGFIFVDDDHRAPADLKITRNQHKTEADAAVHVDVAAASWSLDTLAGEPAQLWITSSSTVPALIPVPPELLAKGGVFDLHLSKGRSLALTFLERRTKQPLPQLEFQLSRSIETGGNQTVHRTDAHGQARVTGIPLTGHVSVTVDFAARDRDIVIGGSPERMQTQRIPDWTVWLKQEKPGKLDETVLVSLPLGEGCAGGQVPAWAVALVGEAQSVRVVACETTNETPQGRGAPFVLEQDEQGHFELCENAPSTHVVWLEQATSGERISAETGVNFAQAGPQDPVSFREIQGSKVTLNFINVPERGQLQARMISKSSAARAVSLDCKGAELSREFTLTADEQIQLTLRLGTNAHDKSFWTRILKVDTQREITVDLSGSERNVRLECPECGALAKDGTIGLVRCEGGQVGMDQTIVVLCSSGSGITSVHVPNGRWLYRYVDQNQAAIWGVVDVRSATEAGEELVLRPRVRLAPAAEFGAGVCFDEIDGVSLARLPKESRALSVKSLGERIAVPIDAKYSALEAKQ